MNTQEPILIRFRNELEALYGKRLHHAVLFGSRARGDAKPYSDYDVAVFIHGMGSFYKEGLVLTKIETAIARETGIIINTLPFSADVPAPPTILLHNIQHDGIMF